MKVLRFRSWNRVTKSYIYSTKIGLRSFFGVLQQCDDYGEPEQFTSLKDSKGIDVYENDILEMYGGRKYQVIFKYASFWCSDNTCSESSGYFPSDWSPKYDTIVGNVNKNPRTIKKHR